MATPTPGNSSMSTPSQCPLCKSDLSDEGYRSDGRWHYNYECAQAAAIRIKELEAKLDFANDIIWDDALPYMFDVEHSINYHSDNVPDHYRKLAAVIRKLQEITNWRPDPG
jgi:hypothetical protein